MNDEIDVIVREMLMKHTGGKAFFDALDDAIKNKSIIERIYDLTSTTDHDCIIVSGRFG